MCLSIPLMLHGLPTNQIVNHTASLFNEVIHSPINSQYTKIQAELRPIVRLSGLKTTRTFRIRIPIWRLQGDFSRQATPEPTIRVRYRRVNFQSRVDPSHEFRRNHNMIQTICDLL